ncbi:PDZ domain-containing protein [bacterium]|nr:PDZ domain-containing protein [bacterium]
MKHLHNYQPRLYRLISLLPVILLLLFASEAVSVDEPPKPFIGINHQLVKELPAVDDAPAAKAGIRITSVQKNTPAFRAGLSAGDIIIGVDGFMFDIEPDSIPTRFTEILYNLHPGDPLPMTLLHLEITNRLLVDEDEGDPKEYIIDPVKFTDNLPDGSTLNFTTHRAWIVKKLTVILGVRSEVKLPPIADIETTDLGRLLTLAGAEQPEWESWVDETVDRYKLTEDYHDLRERLRRIEAGDDGYRLPAMAAIHCDPAFLETYGRHFTDGLMRGVEQKSDCSPAWLMSSVYVTGNEIHFDIPEFEPLSNEADETGFKTWFETEMTFLNRQLENLYSFMTPDDRSFLMDHRFELSDAMSEGIYISSDENPERLEHNLRTIELGSRIDLDSLYMTARLIMQFLLETEDRVFSWMEKHPESKFIETRWGKIGFGRTGHDRWDKADFKFIYDPAGDDFYADGTGVAGSFEQPIAWIIDREGNDAYQSTVDGAQGSGLPGVGILIDRSGDDSYIGLRWTQGTGFMGVGILMDEVGDDNYHGTEYIQGAGLFGLGILADIDGNDRYNGTVHAQGVGFTNGLGMLIDYAGDDNGYCTGKYPTNYGDPGIFDAWAQGCGMGFRGIASGGIGVVIDADGEDRWEAGNFSQGGGYYYGFGIFRAGGDGNDTYIGSRYGQGFCAHQAAGLFIEDGGDDFYTTRQGVVTGLAWDECVTIFIDEGGDDYYNGGTGFSLGASAHNSFCLFLDRSGRDEYNYKPGPARAGGNKYHGGSSFSLFVDLGDDQDIYSCDRVQNDVEIVRPEFGVFRDGKGEPLMPFERPEKDE